MQSRHLEAVVFSAKAASAATVAALAYEFITLPGSPWVAAVSAVLVTQPNLHSSFQTSLMRVLANLAGAFGGAVLLAATGQPFVAVIIVTLIGEHDEWHSSFDRVLGVIAGCVCALAVGFLFDKLADAFKLLRKDGPAKRGRQE